MPWDEPPKKADRVSCRLHCLRPVVAEQAGERGALACGERRALRVRGGEWAPVGALSIGRGMERAGGGGARPPGSVCPAAGRGRTDRRAAWRRAGCARACERLAHTRAHGSDAAKMESSPPLAPSQELHVCIVCIEISKLYWNPNTNTIQDCLYSDAIFSIGLYSCISMYNACINPYLYIFVCIVSVLINCSYWLVLHVFYCIDMYCMYCIYCMYCMYWIVLVCIDCIACIVCIACIALYFYVFMCISMYGLYRMFCMYCMYCLVFSCIVCIACIACIAGMCVYWYVLFVLHVLYVFNVLPCIGMYSLYCLYCIYCMYSYVLIVLLVFWLYCLYGAQCHVFAFIYIYLHVLICII